MIVDVKNGLGNRMRALASAMAVAKRLGRPVMLIWVADLHCNCSFLRLFGGPLRFVLLEEDLPKQARCPRPGHMTRSAGDPFADGPSTPEGGSQ